MRLPLAGSILAALLFAATAASANGRFPAANQLVERPGLPSNVVVRTTFGLLVSNDTAASFDWVCEDLLGSTGDADPPIAVFADGSIAAAPVKGVSVTHDGGCSFAIVGLLPLDAGQVIDLAIAKSQPDTAYAVSWKTAAGVSTSQIFVTSDDGHTWTKTGELLGNDSVPTTIDVAPSDPQRLYAAGTFSLDGGLAAAIFASADGGATWTRTTVDVQGATSLWISAIDPADASRIYARTSGGATDHLLLSTDSGMSFSPIASVDGPMLGFALAPDGGHLAFGGKDGVWVSPTDVIAPVQVLAAPISCLAWGESALYACGSTMPLAPFAVARTTDDGATWSYPLGALGDIRGPKTDCPAGGIYAKLCPIQWPDLQKKLPMSSGSGGAAGTGGDAGIGGAGAGAGGSLSGGAAGSGLAGSAGQPSSPATVVAGPSSSCGCSLPASGSRTGVGFLALLALVLHRRRRHLRASMRPCHILPAVLLALAPATALGNGRFPLANQLVQSAAHPDDVVVRTSFGLLLSHDHARSFRWVCEMEVGYGGMQDPGVALFSDGSVAVAAFEGLALSHDAGCDWSFAGAGLAGEYVIDVATERDEPSRGVVITSTGLGGGKFHVQVFETIDSALTWTPAGVALPDDFLAVTVDVAPSDSQRLYASGTVKSEGAIEISRDRGMTWKRTMVDLSGDDSLYIAAVDPTDANRLYVRTHGGSADRLLVSTDAGDTFTQAASIEGVMQGFAVSPDGSRIAMGGETGGLYFAGRDDLAFVKKDDVAVDCLTWTADGLYACDNGYKHGFTIGVTQDESTTWTPLLPSLAAIVGPLDTCAAAGPFHAACDDAWPPLAKEFGKTEAGGSAGSGGAGGAADTATTPGTDGKSGCGCRTTGPSSGGAWWAVLGALLLLRRRRAR